MATGSTSSATRRPSRWSAAQAVLLAGSGLTGAGASGLGRRRRDLASAEQSFDSASPGCCLAFDRRRQRRALVIT
ncbi:MAG TPA: hypothetical protein VFH06_02900 [Candidatus Saccharimonadales bacterium]|nr:hypothetical protein [Candidatus Saccharimonadales bacterium]